MYKKGCLDKVVFFCAKSRLEKLSVARKSLSLQTVTVKTLKLTFINYIN